MKVLIAEDDSVSRMVLRKALERWGHSVYAAEDGAAAWKLFEQEEFPLVISDWMMPEVDGLELVRRIRSRQQSGYVYAILLTARSQKEDIVAGMEAGADDFVLKPFHPAELHARMRAGERILQLEQKLAARNQELEAVNALVVSANERMKRDLDAAAKIQEALLPTVIPEVPEVNFAWAFKPCDELAGDILNIIRLDEKHVAIYVLDVSNHGVPAALLAVTLSRLMSPMMHQSQLLKQLTPEGKGYRLVLPSEVATQLNRQFQMQPSSSQYFTILYAILSLETRELVYVQAGHPNPIYVSAGSKQAIALEGGGLPIGFMEDTAYSDSRLQLRVEDRVYIYSDGIHEAKNISGEQFGEERMLQSLYEARHLSLNDSIGALLNKLEHWGGEAGMKDDVSILALEIKGSQI